MTALRDFLRYLRRRARARAIRQAAIEPWPVTSKRLLALNVARTMNARVNGRAWRKVT